MRSTAPTRRRRFTPWIGVWERINIGVFLLWIVVLATALLRARDTAAGTDRTPLTNCHHTA